MRAFGGDFLRKRLRSRCGGSCANSRWTSFRGSTRSSGRDEFNTARKREAVMNDLTMDLYERLRMAPPEIHRRLIEFLAHGIEEQWRKEIATEPGSRPSDVIEVVDLAARIE